jgi:hypothetical protein
MRINSARNSLVRARNLRSARRSRSSKLLSSKLSSKLTSSTSSSKSTSSTKSTTSSAKTKQISKYETVESKASDIQSLVTKMINMVDMEYTDDETGETAKENAQSNLVSYIEDFVSDYNTVHDTLYDLSGSSNLAFKKALESIVTSNKSALSDVGITVDKSGDLSVDKETLKAADSDSIKTLFQTKNGFAGKISSKMETIEDTASKTVNTLNYLYGTTSTYSSLGYSNYYNTYGTSTSSWYL